MAQAADLWALVLAGGDGTRLRELTRLITGAPIPKQYCRITGDRSLLEATLARIEPLIPRERTLVIVNRNHLDLAGEQLAGLPPENILVQPRNHDTGPGLLFGLLSFARRHERARLAVFPSDHYIGDDRRFLSHVEHAGSIVDRFPGKIALLGIRPDRPDTRFGYVEPAHPLPSPQPSSTARSAFHVAAFREKPTLGLARRMLRRGGLWNSFIMVFRVDRMLELLQRERPEDFASLRESCAGAEALTDAYASLAPWNFSCDFLARIPMHLAVLPVEGVGWSDWGTPQAIEETFADLNKVPPWRMGAQAVAAAVKAS
jgi:mannose-1-phosphate guanylyltransferase